MALLVFKCDLGVLGKSAAWRGKWPNPLFVLVKIGSMELYDLCLILRDFDAR